MQVRGFQGSFELSNALIHKATTHSPDGHWSQTDLISQLPQVCLHCRLTVTCRDMTGEVTKINKNVNTELTSEVL